MSMTTIADVSKINASFTEFDVVLGCSDCFERSLVVDPGRWQGGHFVKPQMQRASVEFTLNGGLHKV